MNKKVVSKIFIIISPIVLTFILSFMPIFNSGLASVNNWDDQKSAVNALNSALENKNIREIESGQYGPTFIALAKAVSLLYDKDAKQSLIILNRMAYLLSFLIFNYIFIILLFYKKAEFLFYIPLAFSVIFAFGTNFSVFSDVPWTHFMVGFFIMSIIFSYLIIKYHNKLLGLLLFGVFSGLIATTRLFEFKAMIGILFLIMIFNLPKFIKKLNHKDTLINFAMVLIGFIISYSFHSFLLDKFYIYASQYNYSDGMVAITYDNLIHKTIQLFIDIHYLSFNAELSSHTGYLYNTNLWHSWRYPLMYQIPLLIVSLFFIFIIPCLALHKRKIFNIFLDNFFLFSFLLGLGLVIAYTGNGISGSPHLKYGFVRDYYSPVWLILISLTYLIINYVILLTGYTRHIASIVMITMIAMMAIFIVQPIKKENFIMLDEYHIKNVKPSIQCKTNDDCKIKYTFYNQYSKVIKKPNEIAFLNIVCDDKRIVSKVVNLDNFSFNINKCKQKLSIFPIYLFTGLYSTPNGEKVLKVNIPIKK